MTQILLLIGEKGIVFFIGLIVFMMVYKYSVNFFAWIEEQTYGTKEYILKKCEFLHITIKETTLIYSLFAMSFGSFVFMMIIFAFLGNLLLGSVIALIFFFIGWKSPRPIVDYLVEKRIEAYQNQMVDGLNLLSNGLRAGLSLPQSLGMVVAELPPPISQEFNLILQQNKIGSPLEECFEDLAKRIPSEDNKMFVTSVNVLKETGGNLSETFDTIAGVIRERVRLQQKISAVTAQGRFQGATIFAMPFLMGIAYAFADPESMEMMVTNPIGIAVLLVALTLNLAGGYAILQVVKIQI